MNTKNEKYYNSNSIETQLIHGDFFQEYKKIETGSIDLLLTDPPYNIFSDIHSWDTSIDLVELETIFSQLLKPTCQVIIFCDLNLMVKLMGSFNNRLKFKHYHIWKKPGGMPVSLNRPINDSEFILVFKQAGVKEKELTFNPEAMGEKGDPYIKRNYSQ
ncbi:MAG: DNA methyltransferase, partial [Nitrosopumilus sp.]